jgi:sulfur carrier protein
VSSDRDLSSRREESPEVIEGGAARRGSESAARDQASGRAGVGEPLAGARAGSEQALATVRVRVNSGERSFGAGTSIAGLLDALGVSTPRVAVERNRAIVPKAAYDSTLLEEGDELEVVEFVGGG